VIVERGRAFRIGIATLAVAGGACAHHDVPHDVANEQHAPDSTVQAADEAPRVVYRLDGEAGRAVAKAHHLPEIVVESKPRRFSACSHCTPTVPCDARS